MTSRGEKIAAFVRDADAVADRPPRLAEQTGVALQPLIENIPHVSFHLMGTARPSLGDSTRITQSLRRVHDVLLYNVLLDNYHHFVDSQVQMGDNDENKPCNSLMLIYQTLSYAALVLDALVTEVPAVASIADTQLTLREPATALSSIRRSLLVCAPETYVYEYSVCQLVDACAVLSARWHELAPSPELQRYLLSLMHRGFILMTAPGPRTTFDDPNLCKLLRGPPEGGLGGGPRTPLFSGNWTLLRRLAGGLTRMAVMTRFRLNVPTIPEPLFSGEDLATRCSNIRTALMREAVKLEDLPSLRRELKLLFNSTGLWYGDLDVFIEKCGNDPARHIDIIFQSKPLDIQQAWMYLNQAVSLVGLCTVVEGAPFYHQLYTFADHFYAQGVKLYVAEIFTRSAGVLLLANHHATEQDFFELRGRIIDDPAPVIITSFGALHVMHEGTLHVCESTEHALLTWIALVQRRDRGMLPGEKTKDDLDQALRRLLNDAPIYDATDPWKDTDIIYGDEGQGKASGST
jgi:hypothetical protein